MIPTETLADLIRRRDADMSSAGQFKADCKRATAEAAIRIGQTKAAFTAAHNRGDHHAAKQAAHAHAQASLAYAGCMEEEVRVSRYFAKILADFAASYPAECPSPTPTSPTYPFQGWPK